MKPSEFRQIRERLGLTQKALAEIFGLSGYIPISHYESGFRKPSSLIMALMRLFDRLPEKESKRLRELIAGEMSLIKRSKRPSR